MDIRWSVNTPPFPNAPSTGFNGMNHKQKESIKEETLYIAIVSDIEERYDNKISQAKARDAVTNIIKLCQYTY